MGLFDQGKMLLKAKQVQKELKNTEVEAKSGDGSVMVVVNGEMHLKEIRFDENFLKPENKRLLERNVQQTMSEALSRAQAIAAEKTKAIMKDMNLNFPGM
jgi:DNA-binding YbaB/EbfC family protein